MHASNDRAGQVGLGIYRQQKLVAGAERAVAGRHAQSEVAYIARSGRAAESAGGGIELQPSGQGGAVGQGGRVVERVAIHVDERT